MKKTAILALLAAGILPASAMADFPEIPFCPLGGPPGWFNRLKGDDHRYYPPPPRYYPAQARPAPWMPPPAAYPPPQWYGYPPRR